MPKYGAGQKKFFEIFILFISSCAEPTDQKFSLGHQRRQTEVTSCPGSQHGTSSQNYFFGGEIFTKSKKNFFPTFLFTLQLGYDYDMFFWCRKNGKVRMSLVIGDSRRKLNKNINSECQTKLKSQQTAGIEAGRHLLTL